MGLIIKAFLAQSRDLSLIKDSVIDLSVMKKVTMVKESA